MLRVLPEPPNDTITTRRAAERFGVSNQRCRDGSARVVARAIVAAHGDKGPLPKLQFGGTAVHDSV